jgi:hypothetical protein
MAVGVDSFGDIFISEPPANRIRVVVAPEGRIATLAGGGNPGYTGDNGPSNKAQLNNPIGVRFHNGFLYFCDTGNNVVRKIDTESVGLTITTVGRQRTSRLHRRWRAGLAGVARLPPEH